MNYFGQNAVNYENLIKIGCHEIKVCCITSINTLVHLLWLKVVI